MIQNNSMHTSFRDIACLESISRPNTSNECLLKLVAHVVNLFGEAQSKLMRNLTHSSPHENAHESVHAYAHKNVHKNYCLFAGNGP